MIIELLRMIKFRKGNLNWNTAILIAIIIIILYLLLNKK